MKDIEYEAGLLASKHCKEFVDSVNHDWDEIIKKYVEVQNNHIDAYEKCCGIENMNNESDQVYEINDDLFEYYYYSEYVYILEVYITAKVVHGKGYNLDEEGKMYFVGESDSEIEFFEKLFKKC